MGISVSKRVKNSLSNSPEFDSACDSVFSECLALTQHAFKGVFPYQLASASDHLYRSLSATDRPHRLVLKWVSQPPTRSEVDSALRAVTRHRHADSQDQTLGPALFKQWAVELFTIAVMSGAGKAMIIRVPVGIAGIAGIGAVTRSGKNLVGTAIGVYSLGVSTAIYLSLCL